MESFYRFIMMMMFLTFLFGEVNSSMTSAIDMMDSQSNLVVASQSGEITYSVQNTTLAQVQFDNDKGIQSIQITEENAANQKDNHHSLRRVSCEPCHPSGY